jgi:hypothetical protein
VERFDELVDAGLLPEPALPVIAELACDRSDAERNRARDVLGLDLEESPLALRPGAAVAP